MREEQIEAVAALHDSNRRAIYRLVSVRQPVARDEVAVAVGLPRSTVAFHLERLVEAGLLSVTTERRSGRTGPGAGRPARVYSISGAEVAVSVPERRYDLMGDILSSTIEDTQPTESPLDALRRVATMRGRQAGAAAGSLGAVLDEVGYHPVPDGDGVALANCPFHTLAGEHTEVVCQANHAFLCGVAEASGDDPARVQLRPSPGRCCIRIGAIGNSAS